MLLCNCSILETNMTPNAPTTGSFNTKLYARIIASVVANRGRSALAFSVLFIVIIPALLSLYARATHTHVEIESENGSLDGSISVLTDPEASNEQAVGFGELNEDNPNDTGDNSPPPGGGSGGGEGGSGGYTPASMGPSGRWPSGFPTYATQASIVTNGTIAGLQAAINQLSSSGGVIQHAGNVANATITRSSGTAPIVVRPPLGQRADFTISGTRLHGSGILLAGWRLSGSFRVHNAINSGVAWIEADSSLWFETAANSAGNTAHGLMYELVAREYKSRSDRSRLWSNGSGSVATMDVVGSWLTGSTAAPPTHADTIQVLLQSGGTGMVNIKDSVIWPSWDKALQGSGIGTVFTISNSWIAEPSAGEDIWPGGGLVLDGHHAITAVANMTNSILLGSVHSGFAVTVSGSTLYNVSGIINGGGNTTVAQIPLPPPAPTHTQLDSIWHP